MVSIKSDKILIGNWSEGLMGNQDYAWSDGIFELTVLFVCVCIYEVRCIYMHVYMHACVCVCVISSLDTQQEHRMYTCRFSDVPSRE